MSRRIISSILIGVFLIGIFVAANPLTVETARAEEFRRGFSLIPENSDSTGVQPDSKYSLITQTSLKLEELNKVFVIDGEPAPKIEQENSRSFVITPSRILDRNKLYTFRIKNEKSDITWTFQTSAAFKILGVFPGDKTTGVPVNSGIEVYFSHEDYEDMDKYFEISPSVTGTFERHKKAVVFVPSGLKEGTLYTVTIKKGLKLKGTDYTLPEDYVFMFETENKSGGADENNYYKGCFTYNKHLNEFKPGEKPNIPVDYYINRDRIKEDSIKVKTTVYSYNNADLFINALKGKSAVPSWAYLNYNRNFISSEGLNKTMEFEQEFSSDINMQQFIKLPNALPSGYYLLDSKWEDVRFQTFIEVTDIGMYIARSDNKTLLWLNDLSSRKPIEGASVSLVGKNDIYTSDSSGIAFFDTPASVKAGDSEAGYDSGKYLKLTTKDGKSAILEYNSYAYRYFGSQKADLYWNYLQMDRSLFKPDDTVNFWGFVKNRYTSEKITSVTVEISPGYRYYSRQKYGMPAFYYPRDNQPLVSGTADVVNGIFHSSISLPSLEPGSYQLVVKIGDEIIASTYMSVENYVKPPYRLDITKNKEAVFCGEQVDFNVKASFFEGTGVPNLKIDYNIENGFGGTHVSGTKKTDSQGIINIKYTPSPVAEAQGENYSGLYVRSSLPEIGEMSENNGVRVFVNDINVNITTEINKDKKIINAAINKITLDRLNNGTAKDNSDFLSGPVSGKTLHGILYKNTWVKKETGQYYDFVNKVTQKTYTYETHTVPVKNFSMTTDVQGKASFDTGLPDLEEGWYHAALSCTDNSGKSMKFDYIYIGKYYDYNNNSYEDNRYYLEGGKESYKLDEAVNLVFAKGTTPLHAPDTAIYSSFLFVNSQNGIRNYSLANKPEYSFVLSEKDIPNTYVTGVYFNGITYVESEPFNCVFDYSEKDLKIDASLDKSSYKPGDEVTIRINARNKAGIPQKAFVNASIVDEALFKLQNQEVTTLANLYGSVPSGINYTYQSHRNSGLDSNGGMAAGSKEDMKEQKSKSIRVSEADSVREDFRDTAYFNTITLDNKGYGELKFKLPDNITSWRVTLSGVTTDLMGGSSKVELKVSLPFFINYSMNTTYLSGDMPVLCVNAYGNDLKENDIVSFEVSSTANPTWKSTAKAKAFERVNIPLWKLSEGKHDIIIKASAPKGLTDSIKHKITVMNTYHQIDKAVYYKLSKETKLKGGAAGNTKLIFTDEGKGAFLPALTGLLYGGGNRIDQRLSSKAACGLIKKYFKNDDLLYDDENFKVTDYQAQDGGIAVLPYGSSDADLSAKLTPMIKDEVSKPKLKDYFYGILYSDSPGLKGNALYGLAALGEPVLLDLDKAVKVENASVKDLLYIAMAYYEIGETDKAERLFNSNIIKYVEEYKPYFRVNTGIDKDDILECTSLASLLASKLDKPQKKGLYDYCLANSTKDILINLEKLMYISQEISKVPDSTAKFSYSLFGKKYTRTLKNGGVFILNIPSQKLNELKITGVNGSVSVVSVFREQTAQLGKLDNNISVTRHYYKYNAPLTPVTSFKENDIVKVVLDWDIGRKAIEGGYQITDFAPSGLKPIDSPYTMGMFFEKHGCYGNIDGQKVSFYIYSGWDKNKYKPELYYYARVVSPGTYKADGAIIQGIASKDSINVGKTETITIK